ncbi:MAG: HAD family hydrolase [Clostridia bacterium]|jgi:phosphoglycolate phosphatase-like HAD superfamily hydrolase
MSTDTSGRLVFLDFDGVICDSLPECYEVSLEAYYQLYLKLAEPPTSAGGSWSAAGSGSTASGSAFNTRSGEALFRRLRPYIRRGGDYLFIQMAIHQGIAMESQADFDALVAAHHELDDPFHELFYVARNALFRNDPARWYSLNPLYPGIKEYLQRHSLDRNYLILSTKEAGFIAEILRHHGIAWDKDRIYCSGKERKLAFIDRVMDELGGSEGIFIDDQIDHFKGSCRHPVRCLLADWGYVMPQWLAEPAEPGGQTVEVLSLNKLDAL